MLLTGQGSTGGVVGVVTDPGGGAIPSASVTVTNLSTGWSRATATNREGAYSFSVLDPGPYRVKVSAKGFKDLAREPIEVKVSESATVPLQPEVGAATDEALTVNERESPVTTTRPTLGTVFLHRQIVDLPLVTRNFTQLLALEPGVVGDLPNAAAFGNGTQGVSVSGSRYYDNSVLIDGINANGSVTYGYSGQGPGPFGGLAIPAPDAVEQFKVQTSLFSAEFGRAGGASVNLVTRSGTNSFHGDAYEFFRNEALNANDFFLKQSQLQNGQPNQAPLLRENQFGGTFGGPVKRDSTFFFVSYQGTRQLNGASPSAVKYFNRYPLLPGDRSDPLALRQALGTIYGGRAGFLGSGVIRPDGSNISAVAISLLRARLPNGQYLLPSFAPSAFNDHAGGASGGQVYSDGFFSLPATFHEHQFTANLDRVLTARQTASARFFWANQDVDQPSGVVPGFQQSSVPKNRNLAVTHTFVLTPNAVNELRGGFTSIANPVQERDPLTAADVGMQSAPDSTRLPQILIATSGLLLNSAQGFGNDSENLFTLGDTVSLNRGAHSIRAGATYVRHQLYTNSDLLKNGQLIIESFEDFLLGTDAATNGGPIGNLLATAAQTGSFEKDYRFNDISFFAQDDWRISRHLILNLGLRYDYFGWPVDILGRIGNFDPTLIAEGPFGIPAGAQQYSGFTVAGNFRQNFPNVAIPSGVQAVSDSTLHPDRNNFAPRLGVAWSPSESFAVRAGFGIFYPRVNAELANGMAFGYPFNSFAQASFTRFGTLADPFSQLNLPPDSAFPIWIPRVYDPSAASTVTIAPISSAVRNPYVEQWNLSVEREIRRNLVIELAYVGSHGLHLVNTRAGNIPAVASAANPLRGVTSNTSGAANIQARSPVAGIVSDRGLALTTTDAESKYEAGIVTVRKRAARGLDFLSSLTFGKSIDNNSLTATGTASNAQAPNNNAFLQQYGLSSFDRKYRWVTSFTYELPNLWPARPGLRSVFGGWAASGILALQSGTPITLFVTPANSAVVKQGFVTPDVVPGTTLAQIEGHGTVEQRLNNYFGSPALGQPGSVFLSPGPLRWGDLGRGLAIRSPGQRSFDVEIRKEIALTERARLQVRVELFNALNWVNFSPPAANVSNSAFGTITSTTTAPRVIQLACKVQF